MELVILIEAPEFSYRGLPFFPYSHHGRSGYFLISDQDPFVRVFPVDDEVLRLEALEVEPEGDGAIVFFCTS